MKPISLLTILCFCSGLQLYAQNIVIRSIADKVVAGQKVTITGSSAIEQAFITDQKRLIQDLEDQEEKYDSKRGTYANISANAFVFGMLQYMISQVDQKIPKIEYNIRVRKLATFGILHGLSRFESDLKRQKAYLEKLKHENTLIGGWSLLGVGGAGHLQTASITLLSRVMKVKNKVFEIDKNVKALMGASKLLAQ